MHVYVELDVHVKDLEYGEDEEVVEDAEWELKRTSQRGWSPG